MEESCQIKTRKFLNMVSTVDKVSNDNIKLLRLFSLSSSFFFPFRHRDRTYNRRRDREQEKGNRQIKYMKENQSKGTKSKVSSYFCPYFFLKSRSFLFQTILISILPITHAELLSLLPI